MEIYQEILKHISSIRRNTLQYFFFQYYHVINVHTYVLGTCANLRI